MFNGESTNTFISYIKWPDDTSIENYCSQIHRHKSKSAKVLDVEYENRLPENERNHWRNRRDKWLKAKKAAKKARKRNRR